MLSAMETRIKPGGIDFAKPHPDPAIRIEAIKDNFVIFQPVDEHLTR